MLDGADLNIRVGVGSRRQTLSSIISLFFASSSFAESSAPASASFPFPSGAAASSFAASFDSGSVAYHLEAMSGFDAGANAALNWGLINEEARDVEGLHEVNDRELRSNVLWIMAGIMVWDL